MARVFVVSFAGLLALPITQAGDKTERQKVEKQKIEALITHVEDLKDAKFVRNDREYDAKTAAKFLRGKWEANEAKVKTAKDFIDKAASVSSTTGKPYLIRFKDGKDVKSGDYLRAELQKLEKPTSENAPTGPRAAGTGAADYSTLLVN